MNPVTDFQIFAIICVMILSVVSILVFAKHLFPNENEQNVVRDSVYQPCENKCRYVRRMEFLLAGIVIAVSCVAILTILLAGDPEAFTNFSFASTVSSIILSVIAIFMTISGEAKASVTKERMELAVTKLDDGRDALEKSNGDLLKMLLEQREVFENILAESKRIHEGLDDIKSNLQQKNISDADEYKVKIQEKGVPEEWL